jgi:hypothetical protein
LGALFEVVAEVLGAQEYFAFLEFFGDSPLGYLSHECEFVVFLVVLLAVVFGKMAEVFGQSELLVIFEVFDELLFGAVAYGIYQFRRDFSVGDDGGEEGL